MTRVSHSAALLVLALLLSGCGSCQRTDEGNGGGGGAQQAPAKAAAPQGAAQATMGRIAIPTVARGADLGAPPAPQGPEAPAEEPNAPEPLGQGDCVVIIDADPDFGEPPLSVNFSVEAQCTSGTPTYAWDFGDGTPPSTEPAPVHVYQKAGEFTVTLKAMAPDGSQASDDMAITVEETVAE